MSGKKNDYFSKRIELAGLTLTDVGQGEALQGALSQITMTVLPNATAGQSTGARTTEPDYYFYLQASGIELSACGLWEKTNAKNQPYLVGSLGGLKLVGLPNNRAGGVKACGSVEPDYQLFALQKDNAAGQRSKTPPTVTPERRGPRLPKRTASPTRPIQIASQTYQDDIDQQALALKATNQVDQWRKERMKEELFKAPAPKHVPKKRHTAKKAAIAKGPDVDPSLNDELPRSLRHSAKAKGSTRPALNSLTPDNVPLSDVRNYTAKQADKFA